MKANVRRRLVPSLSACTIAKNEEQNIAKSIASYAGCVDEVIVVDTGSSDGTVQAAEAAGARVIRFPWCDDFSAAKNTALDAALGDWIVFLDADEYFEEKTAENLRAVAFSAQEQGFNAVGCRMQNYDVDSGGRIADGYSIRLFRKGVRYRYAVHEEISFEGGLRVLNVDKSYFYLGHSGYSSSRIKQKCERNIAIMLRDMETTDSEDRKTIYLTYISDAYAGMGDWEKAKDYALRYLKKQEGTQLRLIGLETKPYLNILNAMAKEKAAPEEIEPWLARLERAFPDNPDAAMERGKQELRNFRFAAAFAAFRHAEELSGRFEGTDVDNVVSHKALLYNFCGTCEEALYHMPEAVNWYFKGAQEESESQIPLLNLFRVLRPMPEDSVTEFTDALYGGSSASKRGTMLAALLSNYMGGQATRCYARLRAGRENEPVFAQAAAYFAAAKGEYAQAAGLFLLECGGGNKTHAMHALVCAALQPDAQLLARALEAASPACAFAADMGAKPDGLQMDDAAAFYAELCRMGRPEKAAEWAGRAAGRLTQEELAELCRSLCDRAAYLPALAVLYSAALTPETVFLRGYCCYRLGRFFEAEDFLRLAHRAGGPLARAAEELARRAQALQPAGGAEARREQALQARLAAESGDFDTAWRLLSAYRREAVPDAALYSVEAAVRYYRGDSRGAALAAESGLLRWPGDFDLLYNAACAYEKLGDKNRAAAHYKRALERCTDESLRGELVRKADGGP